MDPEHAASREENRRPAGSTSRWLIIVTFTGSAALLLVWLAQMFLDESTPVVSLPGLHDTAPTLSQTVPGPAPVQVLKPHRRDIARTITLPANISPWFQATLYAKVPGYLKWMGFDKGDWVKKGQLLAVIDAPEIEQQYKQAEADYKIKQLTFQRLYNVWKDNPDVIAKQDVDVAEAAAEASKHLLDNRRTFLDYTKVLAPFSGVITARFADPGALIQSAATSAVQAVPLFTLMDLDTVRVYVSVPQEVAYLAKAGLPAALSVRELSGRILKGFITRTTEALDPATRTLLVEIDLPNKEHLLQPGTFVNASLSLEQHPNALVIPPAALIPGGNGRKNSVFVIENGKAIRVAITTGIDDGLWIEVTGGLAENQDVVVVGKSGLTDGQSVQMTAYNLPTGQPSSQAY